ATRAAVDAFLEELVHWEQDPEAFARDPALTQRIDTDFVEMILAFVAFQIRSAPVYLTQDLALNRGAQDLRVTQALTRTYQLVPQGLVFQLFADRDFHAPRDVPLVTRGLTDGSRQFEPDDVFRVKVFPVYASMLYNRGRYLALYGRHDDAVAAYTAAL